jgi:hypothetical protein
MKMNKIEIKLETNLLLKKNMNERKISKQNCMPPNWGASNFLSKCSMIYKRTNTIFGNVVKIH